MLYTLSAAAKIITSADDIRRVIARARHPTPHAGTEKRKCIFKLFFWESYEDTDFHTLYCFEVLVVFF